MTVFRRDRLRASIWAPFLLTILLPAAPASADPLPAPANLQATIGCDDLVLTWDPVPGAVKYRLTYDGSFHREVTGTTLHEPMSGTGNAVSYGVAGLDSSNAPGAQSFISVAVPYNHPIVTGDFTATAYAGQPLRLRVMRWPPVPWFNRPDTFSWFKDGQPLTSSLDGRVQVIDYLPDSSVVVITSARAADSGEYTCQACNVCGCGGAWGVTVNAGVPLPAPTNLQAVPICQGFLISWDPVPFAARYRVEDGVNSLEVDSTACQFTVYRPDVQVCTVTPLDIEGSGGDQANTPDTQAPWPPYEPALDGDQVVVAGAPLILEVLFSDGFDPAGCHFDWRRDGNPIPSAPDSIILVIPVTTAADAGSYDCIITNDCGTDTATASVVTVLGPPANVTATAGCGQIVVSWTPDSAAVGYTVFRDSVLVDAGHPGPPWVDAAPGPGSRCYSVVATYSGGMVSPASAPACAAASFTAPVITTNLPNVGLGVWSSWQYSVTASGLPTTWTWRKNGVPLAGAPNGPSLLLTNLQVADSGQYDVIACNACGCDTSNSASLMVCQPASVSGTPSSLQVVPGPTPAIIGATVFNALSIQWFKNGAALSDGARYSGATTAQLTITNPGPGDQGDYVCVGYGNCSPFYGPVCHLSIVPCDSPPTVITQQPVSQTAAPGSSVTFTTTATGCPNLQYVWLFSRSGGFWSWRGSGPGLTISPVTDNDKGAYRCVVFPPGGRAVYSDPANLNEDPPAFITVSSRPLSCAAAVIKWTANRPVTAQVRFGRSCGELFHTAGSSSSSPSFSDSALVILPGPDRVNFKVVGSYNGSSFESTCRTAYFSPGSTTLAAWGVAPAGPGTLSSPGDAVALSLKVVASGCLDVLPPVTVTSARLNSVPPRLPGGAIDLPRAVNEAILPAGQVRQLPPFLFSRSQLGNPIAGTEMTFWGSVAYADSLPRVSYFYSKVKMP